MKGIVRLTEKKIHTKDQITKSVWGRNMVGTKNVASSHTGNLEGFG